MVHAAHPADQHRTGPAHGRCAEEEPGRAERQAGILIMTPEVLASPRAVGILGGMGPAAGADFVRPRYCYYHGNFCCYAMRFRS